MDGMVDHSSGSSRSSNSGGGTDEHGTPAPAGRRRFELSKPYLEGLVASTRSLLMEEEASCSRVVVVVESYSIEERRHVQRGVVFTCSTKSPHLPLP